MKKQTLAVTSELLKIRHSPIVWTTFIAFSIGPLMGGLIIFLLHADSPQTAMLTKKAASMDVGYDWNSYLGILSQVVGVGGVMVFGFVASWLFGREYSDKTAKDLLALPVSRSKILNAKFAVYLIWCSGLIITNLLLGFLIGNLLGLEGYSHEMLLTNLKTYLLTAAMVTTLGTPIAFFALYGRGYLAPIGFLALALVFSQIAGAIGLGQYFPWAIPGLYSYPGAVFQSSLTFTSYLILVLIAIAGFTFTHLRWNRADQN
ncbi:MAG: ABC transporter permease [Bacteroidia bacterium]|nr:ABC transporter permease [Bacteroidia bacterium]